MMKPDWAASVIVLAVLAGCAQGTPTPEEGIFAGYYTTSFEVSSFVLCSSGQMPGYGVGYWLESEQDSGFYEQYEKIASSPPATPGADGGVTVFVKFRGSSSPPADPAQGGYGHLGQYEREITVTEVIEMALPAVHQCASP